MSNVYHEPPDTGAALAHTAEPMVGGGAVEEPARLAPEAFDYSGGIVLAPSRDANATPSEAQHLIPRNVDWPIDALRSYDMPHAATHRRYEPPFIVGINQASAGYTALVQPGALQYVKVLGGFIGLTAAGTLLFNHGKGAAGDPAIGGDQRGLGINQMGAIPIATNGGFVLPISDVENPWLFTAPDLVLGITTATGLAAGWLVCCLSPYDQ